jgi:hypothetical protein
MSELSDLTTTFKVSIDSVNEGNLAVIRGKLTPLTLVDAEYLPSRDALEHRKVGAGDHVVCRKDDMPGCGYQQLFRCCEIGLFRASTDLGARMGSNSSRISSQTQRRKPRLTL